MYEVQPEYSGLGQKPSGKGHFACSFSAHYTMTFRFGHEFQGAPAIQIVKTVPH